jgi:EmrB/QacA subfamily drug resistance transporter
MKLRTIEYKYLVAIVFITAMFMNMLDSTVVNVALPTLGRQFHASNSTLQWVVTGYLLSLAVWIPVSGWIGDKFGTKRTFLFALGVFTLGSALCGLSGSIEQIIGFRVLQGLGGGMMTPVGSAMLFRAFPPQERAKAAAFLSVPTLLGPMLGPVFGGWLIDAVGWRWIFYINLPVGLFGFALAFLALKEYRGDRAGRFDPYGFVLSGSGLALLLYALSRAPNSGWTSGRVVVTGLGGAACLIAMVVVELRVADPMLNLRLYRDRMFRNASLAFFMGSGGLIGMLFLLPLYLQQLRGLNALQTGLTILPQGLGMGVCLQLTTRIYPYVGPRRMMATGLMLASISSGLFLLVGLNTSLWYIRGFMLLRGIGMSFAMVSNQAATFATIKPQDMGRASSLSTANRQIAGALGVAVLATVLIERIGARAAGVAAAGASEAARQATLAGFHDAFLAATILTLVGFAFAFLVHDEDAAVTLRRRAPAIQPTAAATPVLETEPAR